MPEKPEKKEKSGIIEIILLVVITLLLINELLTPRPVTYTVSPPKIMSVSTVRAAAGSADATVSYTAVGRQGEGRASAVTAPPSPEPVATKPAGSALTVAVANQTPSAGRLQA